MKSFLAVTLALALASPVLGEPSFDAMLGFGDQLMTQKRYQAAELEYERLAFLYSTHPRRSEAIGRLLNAAYHAGDPVFTLQLARHWRDQLEGPARCVPSLYSVRALYELENAEGALKEPFPQECPTDVAARRQYTLALSRLRLRDWSGAAAEFQRVEESSWRAQAQAAAARAPEGERLRWKSPALAGTLSAMVPGSGYLYANRPQTAAAAFTVCGLFIGGTYSAAHAGEPGLAALLALLSLGWYSGGIYGSIQSAHRKNKRRLDRFIQPFEIRW